MKKLLVTFLGILLLTGCTNEKTVSSEKPVPDSTSKVESSKSATEENNKIVTEQNERLIDLPEYAVLVEKISLDTHNATVETDNPGTRIILFENNNGVKAYKSIFVKNDNRLKIIKLDDDGLIYNDIVNR
ncbi:membrane lipoprotein lipid attachment site-containing protein [Sporosarcina sp. E16_8]|uniref:membrane lipoprotein lipid attachment site-containing protein n=1 Tax=Sporosarcina sp. E16_8 TaxID=2789295 RepID=UPI001A935919|nr:membrane lipoprotein lipid attachment site-containing protein [Sporosarcina sp. E16_8]MBO0589340.1 membrane lipoprotein lipid attachment site-containing protein [Sporosarcina sp. E16_8]